MQNLIRSADYDPTDLGYLLTNNQNINTGSIIYNQFTPGKNFLNYNYSLNVTYRRLYKPDRFNDLTISAIGSWTFKNFWETTLNLSYLPDQYDFFVLRKPYLKYARRPAYGFANITGNTDVRKQLLFNYNLLLSDFFNSPGKRYHIAEAGLRYRFSNKFTLELSHRHEAETNFIVYAGREMNGDPIIGFVDFKDVTTIFSGIYNFTPRINLTLRTRHNWSNVIYKSFANVDDKGRPLTRPFIAGRDENFNIFNVDAFFTWDFRLGSRLILGYKNWLGDDEMVNGGMQRNYFHNLEELFSLSHGNEVTLRFIYFLDYNQLTRKK